MTDLIERKGLAREQVELIKRTIAKGATDDELALFIQQCNRTGLDPFARQIYAIKRWDANERREVMAVQVSIDGFRLIAERTNKYGGQLGPFWCGKDGTWREVWLAEEPPAAAKVGIIRNGWENPIWGVAVYKSYVQLTKEGKPNRMWATMPDGQLAKCAESLALRKAFPFELSGLYTTEEMGQAAVVETVPDAQPVTVTVEGEIVKPAPHWCADDQTRKRFWAESTKRTLSNAEAHRALGVAHLAEYPGTFAQALADLDAYVAEKAAEPVTA